MGALGSATLLILQWNQESVKLSQNYPKHHWGNGSFMVDSLSSECTGSILFGFLRGDTDEIENCPNV